MLTSAMRLAFAAWGRNTRELSLANLVFFVLVAIPALLLRWAPPGLGALLALLLGLVWAWLCFATLSAATAQIMEGAFRPRVLRDWIRRHVLERLAALFVTLLLLAWAGLALKFYSSVGLPAWVLIPVLGLIGPLALWTVLALLASVGVAALDAQAWRAAWKASALLPLAYPGAWLGAALLGLALSGLPLLWIGLKHWSAPLFFAPLALSPFITVAYFAATLVHLVRSLAVMAAGEEGPQAPSWRELWNPWR